MNTYREVALQQSENSFKAFANDDVRHVVAASHFLCTPIWVSRVFALCGFAGAVLVLAACFSRVAHLLLNLDPATLPGVAVSAFALVVGMLAMIGSKLLTDRRYVADLAVDAKQGLYGRPAQPQTNPRAAINVDLSLAERRTIKSFGDERPSASLAARRILRPDRRMAPCDIEVAVAPSSGIREL